MNLQENTEPKNQTRNILIIVVMAVSIVILCCIVSLALYLATNQVWRRLAIPTPPSLEEFNGGTALGKFYFGLNSADEFCHITTSSYKFSQEDILRNEYLYLSVPFSVKDEGQEVQWDIYNLLGQSILEGSKAPLALSSDMDNCMTAYITINPRIKPGTYVLVVTHEKKLAYRQPFTITSSDLDKIPRPDSKPFGDITVGRRLSKQSCIATNQSKSNIYTLDEIKESQWFYIASPFQLNDIDKIIYWSVRRRTDKKDIYRVKRMIRDNIDLCFWQGFSMQDAAPGEYTVLIEDNHSTVLYQTDFELK